MQFHRYALLYDFRYNGQVMSESDYTGAPPEKVLKNVFGYDSFRPLQKEIIGNVLAGRGTRHSLNFLSLELLSFVELLNIIISSYDRLFKLTADKRTRFIHLLF